MGVCILSTHQDHHERKSRMGHYRKYKKNSQVYMVQRNLDSMTGSHLNR